MGYSVTLTKDSNGTYLVRFPDVPDAVTFGETRKEALAHAQDALLTVFDAYMKDRREIPVPSRRGGLVVELPALETAKIELYRAMRAGHVGKAELAKRLRWHMPQVDRVLNVRHGSQLDQIEAAFGAVGKRLTLVVHDAPGDVDVTAGRTVRRHRTPIGVHAGVLATAPKGVVGDRVHGSPRGVAARKRAAKKR